MLGIARSAATEPQDTAPLALAAEEQRFGGQAFVETAIFAARESDAQAPGAPGFRNAPDTDPALPANREWAREILGRIETSTAGDATIAAARVDDADTLETIVQSTAGCRGRDGVRCPQPTARPCSSRPRGCSRRAAAS